MVRKQCEDGATSLFKGIGTANRGFVVAIHAKRQEAERASSVICPQSRNDPRGASGRDRHRRPDTDPAGNGSGIDVTPVACEITVVGRSTVGREC